MRWIVTLLAASACAGPVYNYTGQDVPAYFPLDGKRTWEYRNDAAPDWNLFVEKREDTVQKNGSEVITLEYSDSETGDLYFSIEWSTDSTDGVLVHGYRVEGGAEEQYDPPVVFGESKMNVGDEVKTETGGRTFTATFLGVEDCPNEWTSDQWECLHMELDDGDGDGSSGPPFAGEWWIATKYGTSRFTPTGYTTPWILADASWTR